MKLDKSVAHLLIKLAHESQHVRIEQLEKLESPVALRVSCMLENAGWKTPIPTPKNQRIIHKEEYVVRTRVSVLCTDISFGIAIGQISDTKTWVCRESDDPINTWYLVY